MPATQHARQRATSARRATSVLVTAGWTDSRALLWSRAAVMGAVWRVWAAVVAAVVQHGCTCDRTWLRPGLARSLGGVRAHVRVDGADG